MIDVHQNAGCTCGSSTSRCRRSDDSGRLRNLTRRGLKAEMSRNEQTFESWLPDDDGGLPAGRKKAAAFMIASVLGGGVC